MSLDPDWADAHYQLGLLLAAAGQTEEAARHFAETLRLAPGHAEARQRLGR